MGSAPISISPPEHPAIYHKRIFYDRKSKMLGKLMFIHHHSPKYGDHPTFTSWNFSGSLLAVLWGFKPHATLPFQALDHPQKHSMDPTSQTNTKESELGLAVHPCYAVTETVTVTVLYVSWACRSSKDATSSIPMLSVRAMRTAPGRWTTHTNLLGF
jgi:hypothetical protein